MSRDATRVYIVKTHEPPDDDQPTVYIVRNGLAAVRSYKHFLYDFNRLDYSLEQVILGEPLFGSWGRHLDAWNPLDRANTLVLKYEDLVERADDQLDRIAEFIRTKRKAAWINNFAELHEAHPTLFRQGPSVTPTHGFDDRQLQLFSALHGDWMARFNYSQPTFTTQRELRALLAEYTSQLGSPMFSQDRSSSAASLLNSN